MMTTATMCEPPKQRQAAAKDGNIIFYSLPSQTRQILTGLDILFVNENTVEPILRIEGSRMQIEKAYKAIASLIQDLRVAAQHLIGFGFSINKLELFNTDVDSRFVVVSIYDDRLL